MPQVEDRSADGVPPGATGTRSMLSSAVLSTVGIGVQGVSRLAYTVLIGRAFGTEALGHASTLLSLSIFAALLWPTAAGNTVSRFIALALHRRVSDAQLIRVFTLSMVVSSAILAVSAVPVALLLGTGLTTAVLAAWLVAGYGAYAFCRGVQLGYHRAGRVALWDSIGSVVSLGLLVVVCLGGVDDVVLLPLALGYTVFAVACRPRGNGFAAVEDGSPGGGDDREALGFASWNVVAGLTTNGLLQLAMIAAQVYGPGTAAGVYAAAFTLATPASMLGQAVSQIIIPAFAHRSGKVSLRQRGPVLLLVLFTAVFAAVFGGLAALAPLYLPLFYPAEATEAVPLLRLLIVGVFVFTVALIPSALLLSAGRSKAVALTSVAGFVVGVAVMLGSGPSLGVQAGTIGFVAGSGLNLVALLVLGFGAPVGASPVDDDQTSRRATAQ
jgi:O-antigen/teichoic acid export membrane protein